LEAEYTRLTGHTVQVIPDGAAAEYGEMSTITGRITIFHGEQYGGVVVGGRPLTSRGVTLWFDGTVAQPVRGVSAYRLEELYHWFQVRDWGQFGRQNIPSHIRLAIEEEAGEFMRAAGCVPLR
jgi:hypothetical protein